MLFDCRTSSFPDGIPNLDKKNRKVIILSNRITSNTFDLARRLAEKSVLVSIENPVGSLLWRTKSFQRLQKKFGNRMARVCIDYCMYGETHRKRTAIWTIGRDEDSADFLAGLARTCDRNHVHVNLSSWRDLTKEDSKMRSTKGTAAYPPAFCQVWAQIIAGLCLAGPAAIV